MAREVMGLRGEPTDVDLTNSFLNTHALICRFVLLISTLVRDASFCKLKTEQCAENQWLWLQVLAIDRMSIPLNLQDSGNITKVGNGRVLELEGGECCGNASSRHDVEHSWTHSSCTHLHLIKAVKDSSTELGKVSQGPSVWRTDRSLLQTTVGHSQEVRVASVLEALVDLDTLKI